MFVRPFETPERQTATAYLSSLPGIRWRGPTFGRFEAYLSRRNGASNADIRMEWGIRYGCQPETQTRPGQALPRGDWRSSRHPSRLVSPRFPGCCGSTWRSSAALGHLRRDRRPGWRQELCGSSGTEPAGRFSIDVRCRCLLMVAAGPAGPFGEPPRDEQRRLHDNSTNGDVRDGCATVHTAKPAVLSGPPAVETPVVTGDRPYWRGCC